MSNMKMSEMTNPIKKAITRRKTTKKKTSADSADSNSIATTAPFKEEENSDSTTTAEDFSGILLSYICRNDVMLVEVRAEGCQEYSDFLTQISVGLRGKKATPGWEFFKLPILSRKDAPIKLRGAKFHIQDYHPEDDEGFCTWSIGCVYDADIVSKTKNLFDQTAPPSVQLFVEHVERESRSFRINDDIWKSGGAWACQHQFAPKLAHIMDDMSWYDKKFERQQDIDKLKDIMHTNINMLLERGEKADDMLNTAKELEEEAKAFKKNCQKVNKALKRKYYTTMALYGSAGATVVTAAVAVPLVLLL